MLLACSRCSGQMEASRRSQKYCVDCRAVVSTAQRKTAYRKWHVAHLDRVREKSQSWRDCHPDLSRDSAKRSYQKHFLKRKAFRRENADRIRSRARKWRRDHLDIDAAKSRRRHAKLRGAIGSHTLRDFRDICDECSWRCVYCGCGLSEKTATEDHIVAISKGGTDFKENIAPACVSCNSSKYTASVDEFLARRAS